MDEKLKKALEYLKLIAEYDVAYHHGYVDEWNEAASFNEVKMLAQQAIKELEGEDDNR